MDSQAPQLIADGRGGTPDQIRVPGCTIVQCRGEDGGPLDHRPGQTLLMQHGWNFQAGLGHQVVLECIDGFCLFARIVGHGTERSGELADALAQHLLTYITGPLLLLSILSNGETSVLAYFQPGGYKLGHLLFDGHAVQELLRPFPILLHTSELLVTI